MDNPMFIIVIVLGTLSLLANIRWGYWRKQAEKQERRANKWEMKYNSERLAHQCVSIRLACRDNPLPPKDPIPLDGWSGKPIPDETERVIVSEEGIA